MSQDNYDPNAATRTLPARPYKGQRRRLERQQNLPPGYGEDHDSGHGIGERIVSRDDLDDRRHGRKDERGDGRHNGDKDHRLSESTPKKARDNHNDLQGTHRMRNVDDYLPEVIEAPRPHRRDRDKGQGNGPKRQRTHPNKYEDEDDHFSFIAKKPEAPQEPRRDRDKAQRERHKRHKEEDGSHGRSDHYAKEALVPQDRRLHRRRDGNEGDRDDHGSEYDAREPMASQNYRGHTKYRDDHADEVQPERSKHHPSGRHSQRENDSKNKDGGYGRPGPINEPQNLFGRGHTDKPREPRSRRRSPLRTDRGFPDSKRPVNPHNIKGSLPPSRRVPAPSPPPLLPPDLEPYPEITREREDSDLRAYNKQNMDARRFKEEKRKMDLKHERTHNANDEKVIRYIDGTQRQSKKK
ncbi:uncharacterized protein EAF01_011851 [Botrytis porri]|uniref:Uncharacterized protein n=1 Tax=Botrytis porri TaxID=87229 RepID=A0A4Z1KQQ7_9HELO|nr:uncharacterized protein EAF01_011851 [Botrytis porri]KAF7881340.1 hypothetical protein EAF01_011851 [Botrytis porri]TGO87032.1 hypothetical protein BPOR_0257g00070 [Botrytis porri]